MARRSKQRQLSAPSQYGNPYRKEGTVTMKCVYRWALTLSLIASCGSVIGLSAARAQDWDDGNGRQHTRRDKQDIRRDQARLRDLERRHREESREGDWREARALDRQIDQLSWHIERDRQDVRRDRWQASRNRDWD